MPFTGTIDKDSEIFLLSFYNKAVWTKKLKKSAQAAGTGLFLSLQWFSAQSTSGKLQKSGRMKQDQDFSRKSNLLGL